ncbi:MAG: alpha-glucosidase [Parvularculaceae bacterium]
MSATDPIIEEPAPQAGAAGREWWRGAVVYQIYPRSFLDATGDGVGDLAGVADRLGYVADLGVDAIWLSPFFKSPMRDFGYDVSDYRDVDPIFGSLADFDRIVAEAHKLGLKVVIDQVYSHTSDEHAWFAESRSDRDNPKADWYVWADPKPDGTPPNNWLSVFGGQSWTWDTRRRQYYLHNFLSSQPDLNLHNTEVQDALLDVARFWLDRGVDGFRLDAINFGMHDPLLRDNPVAASRAGERRKPYDFQDHAFNQSHPDIPKFLERLRKVTDAYGDIFTVAEIGGANPLPEMKSFTERDDRLNSAYSFDFLYADELTTTGLAAALGAWPGEADEGWPSWAFSNHDAPRAVSRWATPDEADAAARLHLMLLMCLRGNAFLYQGEELGLPQAEIGFDDLRDPEAIANWPLTLGRDGARTPMPWKRDAANAGFSSSKPWLPAAEAHRALAVDAQERVNASMLNFTRRMIALRKASPSLHTGDLSFLPSPEGVCALERRTGGETFVCVFNLGATAAEWAPPQVADLDVVEAVGFEAGLAGAPPSRLPKNAAYIARRAR